MRSIKELLELMPKNKALFRYGLCTWVIDLKHSDHITKQEKWKLLAYIAANRPSKWSSINAFIASGTVLYWPVSNSQPRVRWIKKHIKLNS